MGDREGAGTGGPSGVRHVDVGRCGRIFGTGHASLRLALPLAPRCVGVGTW